MDELYLERCKHCKHKRTAHLWFDRRDRTAYFGICTEEVNYQVTCVCNHYEEMNNFEIIKLVEETRNEKTSRGDKK